MLDCHRFPAVSLWHGDVVYSWYRAQELAEWSSVNCQYFHIGLGWGNPVWKAIRYSVTAWSLKSNVRYGKWMLRTSICESLRTLEHSNCINFFALTRLLCALLLKPEKKSSTAQATQISVRFVCVYSSIRYASFYLHFQIVSVAVWITVFARFHLRFQSISVD